MKLTETPTLQNRDRKERKIEREIEMAGRSCYRDVLPFTAMVTMESMDVGLNTLFKAAKMTGMSYHIFIAYIYSIVAYIYSIAALALVPAPFISHRSSSQIMGYAGINYSSPMLYSAISNLLPAFTFILAIIFRLFPSFNPV
ncbi:hypothetical protein RchiOBHm_Chr2g0170691 [Rosa chinensis]|uniref:Uncharacterized protein n=1 Tax=Rosa chinensis TaxID=74649 RepID=A0A2P6S567_ROSCH|nr:hypothetical protein RchiOBHm_Chr2g0170691 [Rosa chinensis]